MEHLVMGFIEPLPTVAIFGIIAVMLMVLGKGANILVDEAVSLSIHWGIPKMVIGATIVSLGTTLPEVTISVIAAINGNPDIALGNAVGSIIANTALIIGLATFIGVIPIDKKIINREGLIQFGTGVFLAVLCIPFLSGKTTGGNITQWMGFVLLGLLILYVYISMKWAKTNGINKSVVLEEERAPLFVQLVKLLFGIILVIISSRLLIPAVEISAYRIGIPDSIIAATFVAFGTSLPELVTVITAVRKGHGELAVGNIIGADILNVLFVVGSAAAVTKSGLSVPKDFYILHLPAMIIILVVFRYFAKNSKGAISKFEGAILLLLYIIYIIISFTVL